MYIRELLEPSLINRVLILKCLILTSPFDNSGSKKKDEDKSIEATTTTTTTTTGARGTTLVYTRVFILNYPFNSYKLRLFTASSLIPKPLFPLISIIILIIDNNPQ